MAALPMAANWMTPPATIYRLPRGSWAISYDIGTNATELDPPNGWGARRAKTYKEIIDMLNLAGFQRHQYSDYRADRTSALHTWVAMWSLRNIRPPMKLESTVMGLKMHYYHDLNLFDITGNIQMGGAGALRLRGPTPANLVPNGMVGFQGGVPAPPIQMQRPVFTKASQNQANLSNWRV